MHYEIRPGWHKPIETFKPGEERLFARRWRQVMPATDSGCWKVGAPANLQYAPPGTFVTIGTSRGEPHATGLFESMCNDCGKKFRDTDPNALFCFGCSLP